MKKIVLFLSFYFALTSWAQEANTTDNLPLCDQIRISTKKACSELKESIVMINYLNRSGYQDNQMISNEKLKYVQKLQNFQLEIKDYVKKAINLDRACKLEILDKSGDCKNQ